MKRQLIAAAMFALILPAQALAQAPAAPAPAASAASDTGSAKNACRDDVQKFCAGSKGDARRTCMETNKDKFSQACKTAWTTARKQRGEAFKAACGADVQKLCSGMPSGGGTVRACIKSNIDKLSEPCKAQMASAPGQAAVKTVKP